MPLELSQTCSLLADPSVLLACLSLQQYVQGKKGISGLRIPGNNLYPLKLVTKVFNLACAQASAIGVDVSLLTHTPVNAVSSSSASSISSKIQTPRGSFETKQVVYATNAYTSHLIPHFATGKQKIVPCRGQVVAVRPKQDKQPFWTAGFCAFISLLLPDTR